MKIQGTPVVSGLAYGPVMWAASCVLPHDDGAALSPEAREAEVERYRGAARTVGKRLTQRAMSMVGTASDVLFMTAALATDKGIAREVARLVEDGRPAEHALIEATDSFADRFKLAGGLMAERVTDLYDIRNRVIAELQGEPEPGIPHAESPVVLFASDLAPADTAGLDPQKILAIVTELSGPTSHTAIIARQLGIPCIVAARGVASVAEGTRVLIDGRAGTVEVEPEEAFAEREMTIYRRWLNRMRSWRGPAITRDGRDIELLVNVQDGAGARAAAEGPAEGVGLLRTELCFIDSKEEPSIEEQVAAYGEVYEAFPKGKVVVRTLDAGSDKPIPYAIVAGEDNPALGVRGLRVHEIHPEIIEHQLDAIAAAARKHEGKSWVMAPMVSTLDEAEWFAREVRARGLKAGIMVEVPAVALQAARFLELVDFVSIGTNDLTQYLMAADRLSPHLADLADPWQPVVLSMIAQTARAGMRAHKPVGVCGEAAADPLLACVLIGMGVTSLSMAASQVPMVGAQLASVSYADCKRAAASVVEAHDALDARRRAVSALGL